MPSDLGAKALAVIVPNAASMVGCMLTGECALLKCCTKGQEGTCPSTCSCPLPMVAWHAGLVAGNTASGYASYLIWKELRGFGKPEHTAFGLYLLSSAAHPILMKKCAKLGCGPAVVNSLATIGLAVYTMQLFSKIDRNAGYCMIPGVILALLCAGCTFSAMSKKGAAAGSCCSGGCCKK